MVRPSGSAARELLLFLIAYETISGEKRDTGLSSGHSLRSLRLAIRADGSLEWGTGKVNSLAKAVAIFPLWVRDFELIERGFGTFIFKGFDYAPWA